jgi:hypothetical protein
VVAGLETLIAGFDDRELARVAGTGAEELAKLLPTTVDRLAQIGLLPIRPTVTEPERRQTRMLESILGLLIRIGERTPIVLALEDLQSADAGTRARHLPRPGLAAGPAVRPATYQPGTSSPEAIPCERRSPGWPTGRICRPSSRSSHSTATSSPSSSRGSRASARPLGPASRGRAIAGNALVAEEFLAASPRARRSLSSPARSKSSSWPGWPSARRNAGDPDSWPGRRAAGAR